MKKNKKVEILLIGGTGVLSKAVTDEALKQGIGVTMINRGHRLNLIPSQAKLIKADKNDKQTIINALRGKHFDAVFDFLCCNCKDITYSFNLYKNYTSQYFFISSCAVYNTAQNTICYEDSEKILPMWKYSIHKWESEKHLINLVKNSGVNYTIIRPGVTYGNTRFPYGISPMYGYHWTLVARILNKKPIIRWNKGINRCNMTRVEDFAIGVIGLIGNPKAYNEAFNICGDETPSFNDVLDILSKLVQKEVITIDVTSNFYAEEIPERAGEILGGRSINAINSNEKIKSVVPSFKQTIPLEEGMKMTFDAYKMNNYQHGIDWEFDGDTDRIIKKWCKKNKIDYHQYNLGFKDYCNNATFSNKVVYLLNYHKDEWFIAIICKILPLYQRLIRKLKKILLKQR